MEAILGYADASCCVVTGTMPKGYNSVFRLQE